MQDIESAKIEFRKYNDIRDAFYEYLDANIAKKANNCEYDFSTSPSLEAQKVYDLFFKLDYQARKIRGLYIKDLGL